MIRAASLFAILALAGCASDTARYPSLSPRPIERLGFEEPAVRPAAVATPDASLDARLAEVARGFEARERRIAAAFADADGRVARATGPAGSDAWLDAHVALGSLDVLRAEAREALSGLEQAAADRGVAGLPPYPALDDAITRERAAVEAITARTASLGARLAR